ncbi:hypothetical protein WME97_40345 [Sorangium sp. So ce367]|uniref:hypothetical protein n=1 Tax=Sorangium sp. So ce367 TaxID=3133305 RepID=UPI003F613374
MSAVGLPSIRLDELCRRNDAELAPGGIRAVVVSEGDTLSLARRIAHRSRGQHLEAPPEASALARRLRAGGGALFVVSGLEAFSGDEWKRLDLLRSRLSREGSTVLVLSPRSLDLLARAAPNLSSFISPPLWNLERDPDDTAEEGIEAAQRSSTHVNDSPSHARRRLIRRQYEEASKFPGEFVVMIGTRVFFHSTDREEAIHCYESAFKEVPDGTPVFIEPGVRLPERDPVVRGRSLRGA